MGLDDRPLVDCLSPPLTTIHQPLERIGGEVVDLMVRHMAGDAVAPRSIGFLLELVVRESTKALDRTE